MAGPPVPVGGQDLASLEGVLEALGCTGADDPALTLSRYAEERMDTQTRKKGMFGSKVGPKKSPEELALLVNWSADLLEFPLHALPGDLGKDALAADKAIALVFGDRVAKPKDKETPESAALAVAQRAWEVRDLRDEILCQVIRRLRGNPNRANVARGWELMALLCSFVTGSDAFQPTFRAFLVTALRQAPLEAASVWPLVALSLSRQRHLRREHQLQGRSPRPPKDADQALITLAATTPFGLSLEEVMIMQYRRDPSRDVPRVFTECIHQIRRLGGDTLQGIFRIPGEGKDINAARDLMARGVYECNFSSPHEVAGLLKVFFRELAEPLMPPSCYKFFMSISSEPAEVCQSIERMPACNRRVLVDLMVFLKEVSANHQKTGMSVDNLALVFAPTLFRANLDDPQMALKMNDKEKLFVRALLDNAMSLKR